MRARGGQDWSDRRADLHFMREHNRLLVLNCVRQHGPIARVDVARRTGLSRTTVSSIMDALLKEGLVLEGSTQSAARSGGRPAILVHFNASLGYIIGADMGRSHVILLLSDLAAQVRARRSGPFDVSLGPAVCLPRLAHEMRTFLDEQGVAWSQVVGIGLGMPGPMDANLHRTIAPPRMPGWDGVDVQGNLASVLGVPVYIDNDANLGALGESRYGAGVGVADLIYVKIGSGIGGGLVMGGQLYRGIGGSAGEIGHVSVVEDGPVCECGNHGCLEVLASGAAIVEAARQVLADQSCTSIGTTLDVAAVVQAALLGDEACRAAIAHAGTHIGIVLAGLVNVLNPSLILVNGGVARAGDLLLDPIRRMIAERSFRIASSRVRVQPGALGDNAIALGGIALVIDAVFGAGAGLSQHVRGGAARQDRVGADAGAEPAGAVFPPMEDPPMQSALPVPTEGSP